MLRSRQRRRLEACYMGQRLQDLLFLPGLDAPPKQALSLAAIFTILPVRLDVKDRVSGGDDG